VSQNTREARVETSSKFYGRNVTKVCEHANEPRGKIPVCFDAANESRSFFFFILLSGFLRMVFFRIKGVFLRLRVSIESNFFSFDIH